jgi:hypothetical protein
MIGRRANQGGHAVPRHWIIFAATNPDPNESARDRETRIRHVAQDYDAEVEFFGWLEDGSQCFALVDTDMVDDLPGMLRKLKPLEDPIPLYRTKERKR